MSWLSRNLARLGTGDWFEAVWETGFNHNTPAESLMNAGGIITSKTMNHVTAGAAKDNLFLVTGTVEILSIYGTVTAIGGGGVGTDDTMNDLKLETWDGTIDEDITLANSDLTDNGTVGTALLKDAEDSVKMTVLEADAVKYYEGPVSRPFQGGVMVAKNGVATYIRASYTGDAATDITIQWHVRYLPAHPATDAITAV